MSQRICAVPACSNPAASEQGWCRSHYRRWVNTGDVRADKPLKGARRPCGVEGCDKLSRTLGLCNMHAKRFKKTGTAGPAGTVRTRKPCSVADCDRDTRGGGLCLMHYKRRARTGDAEGLTLERRFFEHIAHENERGCWVWDKPHPESGYGQFQGSAAHRWSYEFFRVEIPSDLDIDHLCRNRACVNPWHMDPVPTRVNVLRGIGPSATNARKTHCLRGHEFTEANTYRPPSKPRSRLCRACSAIREKRRRRR